MKRQFSICILSVLVLPPLQPAQEADRPLFRFDGSGKFGNLIRTLEEKVQCQIRMDGSIEEKEIRVSLVQAGFFDALDALCRNHGKVCYFLPEQLPVSDKLALTAGQWIEYPSSYHDHFKVVIPYLMKTQEGSIRGSGSWVEVGMALLAPPWIRVSYESGSRVTWTLEEARDKDDRDLLIKKGESQGYLEIASLRGQFAQHGNVAGTRFLLKEFDITQKMRAMSGKIDLTSHSTKVLRITLEPGKNTEVPGGSMMVDSLTEMEKHGEGTKWRVALTFINKEGKATLPKSVIEESVRFEGEEDWNPAFANWSGQSFELDSFGLPRKPKWMEVRVRTGEHKRQISFRFKDVSFKKEF